MGLFDKKIGTVFLKEVAETLETKETEKVCPRCGAKMVLRTAKKGDNAGKNFYGCSTFPKCRYIENISE